MGWMNSWQCANQVPTDPWRSANTISRELGLKAVGKKLYLTSVPAKELDSIEGGGYFKESSRCQNACGPYTKGSSASGLFRLRLGGWRGGAVLVFELVLSKQNRQRAYDRLR